MKIAIVGSRDFPRLDAVEAYVYGLPADTIIISGGARGVDSTAVDAAVFFGLQVRVIRPDYARYPPRVAPIMRNTQIVEECDALVAFWDGRSRGTADAIAKARAMGKRVSVVQAR